MRVRHNILYNFLMLMGLTLGLPLIIPTVLTTEKRRKTFLQRLGLAGLPESIKKRNSYSSSSKPIWVHALSVGEVLSAVPLVKGLTGYLGKHSIVFSAATKTGFEVASKLLKDRVDAIFFYPYDLLFSVKYVTGKVNPAAVILVETDIWPNFLFELKKRKVPVALVNARLSKKAFAAYTRISFFMKPVLSTFSKICAQSAENAHRFQHLGIPSHRITRTGNIKFDQEFDTSPKADLEELRQSMRIRPRQNILLAGSTHKGEEEILLDAFSRLQREFSDLLLIVAPRDPDRAESVCGIFRSAGLSAHSLKNLDTLESVTKFDVIIIDTIGILRRLYALADIAFVGGSLVSLGGQNPLEPAAYSKPILFGPDMSDFREVSHLLLRAGGAVRVHDADSLYQNVAMLLGDRKRSQTIGKKAFEVFCANKGAVEKTLKEIRSIL
jgi:3-deoxy-D-manno-octulosonic-acid transferase